MNESGATISKILKSTNLELNRIMIIHDDLDLNMGEVRLKIGGGHGGHNGLRDIIKATGNEPWVVEEDESAAKYYSDVESKYKEQITEAFKISNKSDRNETLGAIKNQIVEDHADIDEFELGKVLNSFKELEKNIVRR